MQGRWMLACVLSFGCGGQTAPPPIPDAIQGAYGRSIDDLVHGTMGLEVGADTLKLSEMTITIKAGKLVGDDYQVDLAEVAWLKDTDKVPGKCKGTLARAGDDLLLHLFEQGSDAPCESILEGEWHAWSPTQAFPAGVHGWFGNAWTYSAAQGVEIGETTIVSTEIAPLELVSGMVWNGRDDTIIVTEAKNGEGRCRGPLTVAEGRVQSDFAPIDSNAPGCYAVRGEQWVVDHTKLPKTPLTNGKVVVEVREGTATITAAGAGGMTCTQRILRTQARATTDRGRDGIPVLGGIVLALAPATPEGDVPACQQALVRLDVAQCTTQFGALCNDEFIAALVADPTFITPQCPTHIVIGDLETDGQRVALLPTRDPVNLVCFETIARFRPGA